MNRTRSVDPILAIFIGIITFFLGIARCPELTTCLVPDTGCPDKLKATAIEMVNEFDYYQAVAEGEHYTAPKAEAYAFEQMMANASVPSGCWIGKDTAPRTLVLKAWDGSWTVWSQGGNTCKDYGTGWLVAITTFLSWVVLIAAALAVGSFGSWLIPEKIKDSFYVQM